MHNIDLPYQLPLPVHNFIQTDADSVFIYRFRCLFVYFYVLICVQSFVTLCTLYIYWVF